MARKKRGSRKSKSRPAGKTYVSYGGTNTFSFNASNDIVPTCARGFDSRTSNIEWADSGCSSDSFVSPVVTPRSRVKGLLIVVLVIVYTFLVHAIGSGRV